ncbi:hypothetical protein ACS0PU_000357 [Formica fusca]
MRRDGGSRARDVGLLNVSSRDGPQVRRSRGTRCTVHCHVCRGTSRRVESRRVAARAMATVPRAYVSRSPFLSLSLFLSVSGQAFPRRKLFRTRGSTSRRNERTGSAARFESGWLPIFFGGRARSHECRSL